MSALVEGASMPRAMLRPLGVAALLSIAVAACTSATDTAQEPGAAQARFEQVRARAARQVGDRVIYNYEGDLFFESEDDLRAYLAAETPADAASEPGTIDKLAVFRELYSGYEPTFSHAAARNIRYCVSNVYNNAWVAPPKWVVIWEMAIATAAWEAVANVDFVYLPNEDANCTESNPNVDFAVVDGNAMGVFCAANKLNRPTWSCPLDSYERLGAAFYSNGAAVLHRGVLVTDYVTFAQRPEVPDAVTTVGVLKHELGHILGMRHEHPWGPPPPNQECAEPPDTYTPNVLIGGRRLTEYDRSSVMHYPECNGYLDRDMDISRLDGVGARSIYGQPASWFVAETLPLTI